MLERRKTSTHAHTGAQIWHLRASSRFYPKVQFLNTVAAMPDSAQVRSTGYRWEGWKGVACTAGSTKHGCVSRGDEDS